MNLFLISLILLFFITASLGVVVYTYLRKEQDKLLSSNKDSETVIELTKTTQTIGKSFKGSPVFWILLFILSLSIIAIGQGILRNTPQTRIAHNSIIVGGYRQDPVFNPFIDLNIQYLYTFNIEKSKKINFELPKYLGYNPELSPDGQWIAFGGRDGEIHIIRTDGGQQILIPTSNPYEGSRLTWSPDGKQIAYYPYETRELSIINIDCLLRGESCIPESRFLVRLPWGDGGKGRSEISSPDWSPDGKYIAYDGTEHISIINVDGQSQAIELAPYFSGNIAQPRWSPDGTKIIGVCNQADVKHGPNFYERVSNICVMNRDGSNLTNLTNDTTGTLLHYPQWSPDGQKIAYISNFSSNQKAGVCITMDYCQSPSTVFIMDTKGNEITHLPLEDNVVTEWFFWYP
jgi:Tol biopolymer transport system component